MSVLGLFFTRGISLRKWVDSGLFDREVLIYQTHLDSGLFSRIYWFTYGFDDKVLEKELHNSGRLSKKIIVVQCPPWFRFAGRAGSTFYSIVMPFFIAGKVLSCDVLKTNQMDGSLAALLSSKLFRRPVYVRTGYTLSRAVEKISPHNWVRRLAVYANEYLAFVFAAASSVSSYYDRTYVLDKYGKGVASRLNVVRNYVDTDLFVPNAANENRANKIIYVGRLSPEKNLANAIQSCANLDLELDIIGSGEELSALKDTVQKSGATVRWYGIVANNELPKYFKNYRYFILPSLWEGLPKALIEAMSAGLVCIGNDTTGINEIIEDGVTGFLAKSPSVQDLSIALRRAINADWEAISCAGRDYARNEFSLEVVAAKERAILTKLLESSSLKLAGF